MPMLTELPGKSAVAKVVDLVTGVDSQRRGSYRDDRRGPTEVIISACGDGYTKRLGTSACDLRLGGGLQPLSHRQCARRTQHRRNGARLSPLSIYSQWVVSGRARAAVQLGASRRAVLISHLPKTVETVQRAAKSDTDATQQAPVETPSVGDDTRIWGPPLSWPEDAGPKLSSLVSTNRSQGSVAVDLRHKLNSRRVVLSITGLGSDGPGRGRSGYDQIAGNHPDVQFESMDRVEIPAGLIRSIRDVSAWDQIHSRALEIDVADSTPLHRLPLRNPPECLLDGVDTEHAAFGRSA